jgi:nuclear GTP-binding protein
LKKVIEQADVILEILDARDPEGCRSKELEDEIRAAGKRVVLVLNKIDLVPSTGNVRMWQKYLEREYPCILFRASKQQQQSNLKQGAPIHKNNLMQEEGRSRLENMLKGSNAIGTDNLLQLMKNYARNDSSRDKSKKQITIGVVGFPNVGKSSIINSLKR